MDLPDELIRRLTRAYRSAASPEEAVFMARYMRDQFPFLGIKAPQQVAVAGEATRGLPKPSDDDLVAIALRCWDLREREYQYFACRYLGRHVKGRAPDLLTTIEVLITTKSWWDTVDTLASNVVGPLVAAHRELRPVMDRWVTSDDFWLARSAILHQLKCRRATDQHLLFGYCLERAGDDEFFIQKAIGWALREYSKTAPEAVRDFVAEFENEFARLSVREALKRIGR